MAITRGDDSLEDAGAPRSRLAARFPGDYNKLTNKGANVDDDPISVWIEGLKEGDPIAAGLVWQHYSEQLLRLAAQRLPRHFARMADEEDVVQSAFESLFRRAQEGKFTQLDDRDDLWRLLVTITSRKVVNLIQYQQRQKRGLGLVEGESAFMTSSFSNLNGIQQVPDLAQTPEMVATVREMLALLMAQLPDDEARRVAQLKMEQYTDAEIAQQIGRSVATVERRTRLIRNLWTHYFQRDVAAT